MRSAVYLIILTICLLVAGCFEWTEDSQGNLRSVGVPGAPQAIWASKTAPPIPPPSQLGMSGEEAAKMGGPVLVTPPGAGSNSYSYRYYYADNNHCQDDLNKILAERASIGAGGPAPYCGKNPTAP